MSLQLEPAHLQQIQQHLESAYPQEGCGLLIGQINGDRTRATIEVWPAENAWTPEQADAVAVEVSSLGDRQHSRNDRYWMDPQFLLTAQRYCSDRGLSIIGIYHSHPDYPATPSECDRALAWPEYSYLIVSVRQGVAHESRSWCLDAQHQFEPEPLITLN